MTLAEPEHFEKLLLRPEIGLLVWIFQPDFLGHHGKWDNSFTNHLSHRIVSDGNSSLDKYLFIHNQEIPLFLIILRKDQHLHGSRQILHGDKSHHLILSGSFDRFFRNHASDCHIGAVSHLGMSLLLVYDKVRGDSGDVLFPEVHVLLQGMTADVHAQHLFLKGQKLLLGVLSHIRKCNLELLLLFLLHKVEQRHLTLHGIFLFFVFLLQKGGRHQKFLFSCAGKAVEGSRFDKALDGPLIYLLIAHPVNKVCQGYKGPSLCSLFYNLIHHSLPDALERRQAVADSAV